MLLYTWIYLHENTSIFTMGSIFPASKQLCQGHSGAPCFPLNWNRQLCQENSVRDRDPSRDAGDITRLWPVSKMQTVEYPRIRYSFCTSAGTGSRTSEDQQVLRGCLEVGVLHVLRAAVCLAIGKEKIYSIQEEMLPEVTVTPGFLNIRTALLTNALGHC